MKCTIYGYVCTVQRFKYNPSRSLGWLPSNKYKLYVTNAQPQYNALYYVQCTMHLSTLVAEVNKKNNNNKFTVPVRDSF